MKFQALFYVNEELKILYNNYVSAIKEEVSSIKDGDYLNEPQKNLFYIGMMKNLSWRQ